MTSCYGRDRNQNLELFACDPKGDLKSCCSPGDSCASNGLCVTSDKDALTKYFISGCTEDDWDDPNCLRQCDDTGNGVVPCGTGKFCCYGYNGCDCNNSTQVFTLDPVKIVTTIPTDASMVYEKTSTISDASTGTTSTTQSTSTGTNTAAAETTSSDSASSGNSNALPIGLGVGIGAGVVLLGLGVGFWLWRRKKRASKPTPVPEEYMVKPGADNTNTAQGQYAPMKPAELSAGGNPAELP